MSAMCQCALGLWRQVSGLMGVAMCMYAGVGTQLFSYVKRGTPGGITRQVNFGSFGNTFLVLFQIMTSESPGLSTH
jgi:Ion transport protein